MRVEIVYKKKDEQKLEEMKKIHDQYFEFLLGQLPRNIGDEAAARIVRNNEKLVVLKDAINRFSSMMTPEKFAVHH